MCVYFFSALKRYYLPGLYHFIFEMLQICVRRTVRPIIDLNFLDYTFTQAGLQSRPSGTLVGLLDQGLKPFAVRLALYPFSERPDRFGVPGNMQV